MKHKQQKSYYVYITTNKHHTVLYTGVTRAIIQRIWEHKTEKYDRFTKRYNATKLVHLEEFPTIDEAVAREKQIKAGSRKKKIELIEENNPQWEDLYEQLLP